MSARKIGCQLIWSLLATVLLSQVLEVQGACDTSSLSDVYFYSYTASGDVQTASFSNARTTITNQDTGDNVVDYICIGTLEKTPAIKLLVQDENDDTIKFCIDLIISDNVVLMKMISVDGSLSLAGQCEDLIFADATDYRILVQYDTSANDFVLDMKMCPDDLKAAEYSLTYEETAGDVQCEGNALSIATITDDHDIIIDSCSNQDTYYQPFDNTLGCISTYLGNIFGTSGDTLLILSATFSNVRRFYCARYDVDYTELTFEMSLAALSEEDFMCSLTATATDAEFTSGTAGYKLFRLTSEQCDNLSPCEHEGTCTQLIGEYTCDCVTGYTGDVCETDIDDCVDEPCLNGGECIDGINSFECDCTTGYIGDLCEIPICLFSDDIEGVWALGYNSDYSEYNALTFDGYNLVLPSEDMYICMEQHSDGAITYTSASSTPIEGTQVCMEYRQEGNYLLVRDTSPASQDDAFSGLQCQANIVTMNEPLQLAYPVDSSDDTVMLIEESCPFEEGTYQVTINENGNLGQCEGDDTSVVIIDGAVLDVNSCEDPDDATFSRPWVSELKCAGTMMPSAVDPSGGLGDDIVILAYFDSTSNSHSFYCARYTMETLGYSISLPISDPWSAFCNPSGTAEDVDSQHSQLVLTSNTCASSPCLHGSTCIEGFLSYECDCTPGYEGVNCENEIDECANSPCQNEATCEDFINAFECVCPTGYTGLLCEMEIDDCESQPCLNGGTCLDRENGYYCQCTEGWIWQHCEQPNECASLECLNGGTCEDDLNYARCVCPAGFEGVTCNDAQVGCEPNPCQNGGECYYQDNNFLCVCESGYGGDLCELSTVSGLDTPSIILVCLFCICGVAALLMLLAFIICRRNSK